MLLPGCHIVRTCLFFTVLIAAVISYPYPEDGKKTFNLKIGFDLTQGENGAPKLLVRDFEDSKEINQRATDSDSHKSGEDGENLKGRVFRKSKVARAVSSKSSEESAEEPAKPKEKARSSNEGNSKEAEGGEKAPARAPAPAPRPNHRSKSDEDDDVESDVDNKYSTKGLGAEDFEPEETNPRGHKDNDDDDSRRRRSKRAAKIFVKYYNESKLKRKHKKVIRNSFKPQRTTPYNIF